MNITLSANADLIERTREYAAKHGTTVNQMIRHFMEQTAGGESGDEMAEEFVDLAKHQAGASNRNFHFDRNAAHKRTGK